MSGCSTQVELETAALAIDKNPVNAPASIPVQEQVETDQPNEKLGVAEESTEEAETEAEKDLAPVIDSFTPPFPDRVELFVAPKRQGRNTKKSFDGTDNAVELLGFVKVDVQRVVLSIDGLVSPIAEGEIEAGIEVISIQPPSVVLQRGRQRWQVNLGY